MRTPSSFALIALLCGAPAHMAIAAPDATPLRAEGTEWMLQTPDGARLRSADLIGAQMHLINGPMLRIDSAKQLSGTSGRRWWAHELSVQLPGQGWQPLCEPHSDGTHYAIVLPGREAADGSLAEDPSAFAVSCTSGALAKCLRMGYEPWQAVGGGSMRATYNACVRMVRGDYTGRGVPYTEIGRQIDVYVVHSIQDPDVLPNQVFEAGWDEHGAVCVHHARVAGMVTLQALQDAAPPLRGNVGSVCTEAHARDLGALVFNRSAASPAARN